jgi:hypothetical protein
MSSTNKKRKGGVCLLPKAFDARTGRLICYCDECGGFSSHPDCTSVTSKKSVTFHNVEHHGPTVLIKNEEPGLDPETNHQMCHCDKCCGFSSHPDEYLPINFHKKTQDKTLGPIAYDAITGELICYCDKCGGFTSHID